MAVTAEITRSTIPCWSAVPGGKHREPGAEHEDGGRHAREYGAKGGHDMARSIVGYLPPVSSHS
ncbi:MAG: hypothetical protein M0P17_09130 [Methanoculleus sp.]|nr:hypothetical protein [Methanoculleus sp.]